MDIKDIQVCGHRLLVRPLFPDETTESGIVIVTGENAKRERAATQEGIVLAIGPTAWHAYDMNSPAWAPWCKVGDRIMFAKYGGKFITIGEEDYVVILDEDVQVVLEEAK